MKTSWTPVGPYINGSCVVSNPYERKEPGNPKIHEFFSIPYINLICLYIISHGDCWVFSGQRFRFIKIFQRWWSFFPLKRNCLVSWHLSDFRRLYMTSRMQGWNPHIFTLQVLQEPCIDSPKIWQFESDGGRNQNERSETFKIWWAIMNQHP